MNEAEKLFLDAFGITEEKIKEQMRNNVVEKWTSAYTLFVMSRDKDAAMMILEALRVQDHEAVDELKQEIFLEEEDQHRLINEVYNNLIEVVLKP